jgi:anthranilate phosphoribosyltransferase
VAPEDVGLARAEACAVKGGSPAENAVALRGVLAGKQGPLRDIVLLNSAAALVAADIAAGLAEGVSLAAATIDGGAAARALDRFVEVSNSFGEQPAHGSTGSP